MSNKQNKKKKSKRYYKEGQIIWSVELKKPVKVKSVNKNNLTITVLESTDNGEVEHTFPLWLVDVLKYKAKQKLIQQKRKERRMPTVYFAKVKEDAVIPTKRDEDAGYDIYCNVDGVKTDEGLVHELLLEKGKVNFIPTGIASYNNKEFYLDLKHERSSVAKFGVVLLAGCVDSGFLGEIKIMAIPLIKNILITSKVDEVEELDNVILYPYRKAFAQIIVSPVPKINIKEITYSELLKLPSARGIGGWGSSGK